MIPKPEFGSFGPTELRNYLSENYLILLLGLIAILVTAIYWNQSNTLSARLQSTDTVHSSFSLFQLFFLLIFLYSMKFGIDNGSSIYSKAFESIAAACMGIVTSLGFSYAIRKRRLISEDVTDAEGQELSRRILAEPVTALFTLIFINRPLLWELSWFTYPVFKKVMDISARKLRNR